jgi:putative membrane protein
VIAHLPSVNATLNTLSAVFLALGYYFIRRKNVAAHKKCMLSAFATSSVFLASYITYHVFHGVTHFTGEGLVRPFYFSLLGTHTVLAAAIVPLVLVTLYRAWRGQFDKHRKIARWTLPIWFYVSITGVVVYWMLYHLYPAK